MPQTDMLSGSGRPQVSRDVVRFFTKLWVYKVVGFDGFYLPVMDRKMQIHIWIHKVMGRDRDEEREPFRLEKAGWGLKPHPPWGSSPRSGRLECWNGTKGPFQES